MVFKFVPPYVTLYLNDFWRYETPTSISPKAIDRKFLKLKFEHKNAKNLIFPQTFNMQALGYTAYIETLDPVLPKANEPIGIDGCQGLSYPSLQIIRSY